MKYGIRTQIKRIENSPEGCARGLRVENEQIERAVTLLKENGISPRSGGYE